MNWIVAAIAVWAAASVAAALWLGRTIRIADEKELG